VKAVAAAVVLTTVATVLLGCTPFQSMGAAGGAVLVVACWREAAKVWPR